MANEGKKIIQNIGWLLFDKVFILAINLVVTVKIANYYGADDYGLYQYIISVVTILAIMVTLSDGRVVKKQYSNNYPGSVVVTATAARVLFSFIAFLIGILFLIFSNHGTKYNCIFIVLLVNTMVLNCRFGIENRFEYNLLSKKIVIAADISAVVGCLLQLLAVSKGYPILSIAYIALMTSSFQLVIVMVLYKTTFKQRSFGNLDMGLLKEIIIESLPLSVGAMCSTIYQRCDSVMIGNMLTVTDVGIYTIAVKLVSVIQIAIPPIQNSVYPKMIELYEKNKTEYAKVYIRITSIMTWIYIVGALLSIALIPYIIRVLRPEYYNAYKVFRIYIIGAFFMYNAALRAGHYTLINRGKILMISAIISVVLNLALNYYGIMKYGLYGAALATVITQGVSLLFSNLFFGSAGKDVFAWQIKAINPVYAFRN